MTQGKRDRLSAEQRIDMWRRWKAGESLHESRKVRKLPASLRRSLTWDRGLKMAKHKSFTVATNVKVYFCDPRSS
jgi:IS30 family transposase